MSRLKFLSSFIFLREDIGPFCVWFSFVSVWFLMVLSTFCCWLPPWPFVSMPIPPNRLNKSGDGPEKVSVPSSPIWLKRRAQGLGEFRRAQSAGVSLFRTLGIASLSLDVRNDVGNGWLRHEGCHMLPPWPPEPGDDLPPCWDGSGAYWPCSPSCRKCSRSPPRALLPLPLLAVGVKCKVKAETKAKVAREMLGGCGSSPWLCC